MNIMLPLGYFVCWVLLSYIVCWMKPLEIIGRGGTRFVAKCAPIGLHVLASHVVFIELTLPAKHNSLTDPGQ